ncbi:protein ABHD12B [Manacus vitellinus]|uniref:protein ABHD12B n=1 Tax=Manacus vitellinus TaxID=328815 RepID=UPI00115F24FD|nr:protein ABHD12B [Manacus vitellinus]
MGGDVLRRCLPCRGRRSWLPCLGTLLGTLLLGMLLIYISVPFLIRLFPSVLTKFVYLNFLAFPFFADFRRPELLVNNTISLHLTTEPGVTVGIWHTVPGSRAAEARGQDRRWYEEALADAHPVIIYLHGNGGTSWQCCRAGAAAGVMAAPPHCHLPCHRIATNAARKLQEERGVQVDAVVLESPYTNIREAAAHIPITKIYRQFPGFGYLILDSLARADMFFQSDENVKVLACPLLILHAEDDGVVPPHLGRKLYETARSAYKDKTKVKFITFPEKLGLGHDYISSNPELPALVKDFLNMK